MWNKIWHYGAACNQGNMFIKGTGRWFFVFALISMLSLFLDSGESEQSLILPLFFMLLVTYTASLSSFWAYSEAPNLPKRFPLTYKEDIFYSVTWYIYSCLVYMSILFLFYMGAIGVNLLLKETSFESVMANIESFFTTPHYSLLYHFSLALFVYGTFFPLSFTRGKRVFWATALLFLGAMALYNIAMSLLLNDGVWNFDHFLSRIDESKNGMRVSLLSFGISLLYAAGGVLTALRLHRPKRYDA